MSEEALQLGKVHRRLAETAAQCKKAPEAPIMNPFVSVNPEMFRNYRVLENFSEVATCGLPIG